MEMRTPSGRTAGDEEMKKGIGFLYLSLVIHFYLFFFVALSLDPNLLRSLSEMAESRKASQENENVIVDTMTESPQTPLKGKLSDKPNVDSGKPGDKKNYNYLNPYPGKENREAALTKNGSEQKDKNSGDNEVTLERDGGKKADKSDSGSVFQQPSDTHTSYYDPEKAVDATVDVTMDNYGDISLATVPKEYASYFISMQKKIGANWKEFFPIFQYYQGIIKSGEVHVRFQIDLDGNVKNAAITRSYGYSILDESSLNAVNYSKNFGPLPKGLREMGGININFRFIYIAR